MFPMHEMFLNEMVSKPRQETVVWNIPVWQTVFRAFPWPESTGAPMTKIKDTGANKEDASMQRHNTCMRLSRKRGLFRSLLFL